ncbi:MAG: hypothetical protein H0T53_07555 [Herpetosiphonaceae bacterium]|nr:hypothetical protein [Herpetosiphonaceae bacterium]
MFGPILRVAGIALAAQAGNYLGDTPRHGAGTPMGMSVGPVNITVSNFAPAVVAGILCGGSPLFTLLTGYALSSLIGDRFERTVLKQIGQAT